jgi:hypothetical protein
MLNNCLNLKPMGWALHSKLFKRFPVINEPLSFFWPEVGDLETVVVNLGNWEKFVVKLILQQFPSVDSKSHVM